MPTLFTAHAKSSDTRITINADRILWIESDNSGHGCLIFFSLDQYVHVSEDHQTVLQIIDAVKKGY
jgi:hypothetical protein